MNLSCPPDYEYNTITKICVKKSDPTVCPKDYEWDAKKKSCIGIEIINIIIIKDDPTPSEGEDRITCTMRFAMNIHKLIVLKGKFVDEYVVQSKLKSKNLESIQKQLDHNNLMVAVWSANMEQCEKLPLKDISFKYDGKVVISEDTYMCGDIKCTKENHDNWLKKVTETAKIYAGYQKMIGIHVKTLKVQLDKTDENFKKSYKEFEIAVTKQNESGYKVMLARAEKLKAEQTFMNNKSADMQKVVKLASGRLSSRSNEFKILKTKVKQLLDSASNLKVDSTNIKEMYIDSLFDLKLATTKANNEQMIVGLIQKFEKAIGKYTFAAKGLKTKAMKINNKSKNADKIKKQAKNLSSKQSKMAKE